MPEAGVEGVGLEGGGRQEEGEAGGGGGKAGLRARRLFHPNAGEARD